MIGLLCHLLSHERFYWGALAFALMHANGAKIPVSTPEIGVSNTFDSYHPHCSKSFLGSELDAFDGFPGTCFAITFAIWGRVLRSAPLLFGRNTP